MKYIASFSHYGYSLPRTPHVTVYGVWRSCVPRALVQCFCSFQQALSTPNCTTDTSCKQNPRTAGWEKYTQQEQHNILISLLHAVPPWLTALRGYTFICCIYCNNFSQSPIILPAIRWFQGTRRHQHRNPNLFWSASSFANHLTIVSIVFRAFEICKQFLCYC